MSKIHHIFISHLHGDHIFGLFGLFSSFNLLGRKPDLHIYAHSRLEETIEHFKTHFGDVMTYKIIFHPITTGKQEVIFSDRHFTVEAIPLRHSIPVAGFIFREKQKLLNIRKEAIDMYNLGVRDIRKIKEGNDHITGDGRVVPNSELTLPPFKPRSYAFCTDTGPFTRLYSMLSDIDVLYFEATFSDKDKKLAKLTGHSTAKQAAMVAKNARVGKLLIGHFSTRYKSIHSLLNEAREIFPETYAVEDGEKYTIDLQRMVVP
jgi:ribonuclease Z